MTNNPADRYSLPRAGAVEYEVTRRFFIEVTGNPKGSQKGADGYPILVRLCFTLIAVDDAPGVRRTTTSWQDLAKDSVIKLMSTSNPFDFSIYLPTRIIIGIPSVHDFLSFSLEVDPLTTKEDYSQKYFDLRLHTMESGQLISNTREEWIRLRPSVPCRCISFATDKPHDADDDIRDAYSISLTLRVSVGSGTSTQSFVLPISFDPDIENKGGKNLYEKGRGFWQTHK